MTMLPQECISITYIDIIPFQYELNHPFNFSDSQFLSDFSLVIHAGEGQCQDSCDRDKDIRLFKIFLIILLT